MNASRNLRSLLKCNLFILCKLVVSIYSLHAQSRDECINVYLDIIGYYENYLVEKVYLKYSIQTITDGIPGETTIFRLWTDGELTKQTCSYFDIFQDNTYSVFVIKNEKLILIRPVNKDKKYIFPQFNLDFVSFKDTLSKYTASIECNKFEDMGNLILKFSDQFIKKYGLKRVEIEYDSKQRQLNKGIYDYVGQDEKVERKIFHYLSFTQNFSSSILSKNALDEIFNNGILKDEFKDFQIQDLTRSRLTQ